MSLVCIALHELKDEAPLASDLQSLMTWWMSNSKAASKMLSRGSGRFLESKNTVRHDWKTNHEEVEELSGAVSGRSERSRSSVSEAHLRVEMQFSGFDWRVAVEQASYQVVVPGAEQFLEFQQDVLIPG